MRPFEPEQAAEPTAEEDSGDRLRKALDRNRSCWPLSPACRVQAYRFVRADGTEALTFVSERAIACSVPLQRGRRNPSLLLEGFSPEARGV